MPASPEFYRRHLPHWQPGGAAFFVTFRLKNSLPAAVIAALDGQEERDGRRLSDGQSFVKWDAFLDHAASGPYWLARTDVAAIVSEAMRYRDEREYILHAFCIMPNHVHAVFEPLKAGASGVQLSKIMQSLKRQTARKANVMLSREGAFWQDETYDHVVRDNDEFRRVVGYVLNNPVKAQLVSVWSDWPWTYCREGIP